MWIQCDFQTIIDMTNNPEWGHGSFATGDGDVRMRFLSNHGKCDCVCVCILGMSYSDRIQKISPQMWATSPRTCESSIPRKEPYS